MPALGTGDDFLPAHEGVEGVAEVWRGGGGVCVEGACGGGVVGEEVEVCGVFLEDEAAEGFFVGGAVDKWLVGCAGGIYVERGETWIEIAIAIC